MRISVRHFAAFCLITAMFVCAGCASAYAEPAGEDHVHNWIFSTDDGAVIAECGCGTSAVLSVSAPEDLAYTGDPKAAVVDDGITGLADVLVSEVTYYSADVPLEEAPSEPGEYRAEVVVVTGSGDLLAGTTFVIAEPVSVPHTITVSGGYAQDGKGNELLTAYAGRTVRLFSDVPAEGESFTRWEIESGRASLGSTTAPDTEFIMPDEDVTLKAVFTNPESGPASYMIYSGNGQVYVSGSYKKLYFVCTGSPEDFTKLLVDGDPVKKDTQYMMRSSDSTIVYLLASYEETLRAGRHTIQFIYTDGKSDVGSFTVRSTGGSKTGDSDSPLLWTAVFLVSAGAAALTLRGYRRRRTG